MNKTEDDEVWRLTPWGCMSSVLQGYGFDPERLTSTMGKHMVEDFMKAMVNAGHIRKAEDSQ